MRVEGVGRLRAIERPRHAEFTGVAHKAFVHDANLCDRRAVLRGDEFFERPVVGEPGARVEFEGTVVQRHVFTVLELLESDSQLTRTEITEGTDDVAPHLDDEAVAHPEIVAQRVRSGRMVRCGRER